MRIVAAFLLLLPLAAASGGSSPCAYASSIDAVLGASTPCRPPASCFAAALLAPVPNATLRVVNVGLGTTATHLTHDAACAAQIAACHWDACCHVSKDAQAAQDGILTWYKSLQRRINFFHERGPAESAPLHAEGLRLLAAVVSSGVVAVSDTPFSFLLPELLALAPRLEVVETLRNPDEWAARRRKEHPRELICAEEAVVKHSLESHFELLRCIEAGGVGAIRRQDHEADRRGLPAYAAKMAAHEARTARLAPARVSVCAFDNATGANPRATLRAVYLRARGKVDPPLRAG